MGKASGSRAVGRVAFGGKGMDLPLRKRHRKNLNFLSNNTKLDQRQVQRRRACLAEQGEKLWKQRTNGLDCYVSAKNSLRERPVGKNEENLRAAQKEAEERTRASSA